MHNSIRGILSWHCFFQTRCVRLCFWGHQFQLRFAALDWSIDSDKAWQTMGKLTTNPSKLIPHDWFHYVSPVLHQRFYKSKIFFHATSWHFPKHTTQSRKEHVTSWFPGKAREVWCHTWRSKYKEHPQSPMGDKHGYPPHATNTPNHFSNRSYYQVNPPATPTPRTRSIIMTSRH